MFGNIYFGNVRLYGRAHTVRPIAKEMPPKADRCRGSPLSHYTSRMPGNGSGCRQNGPRPRRGSL